MNTNTTWLNTVTRSRSVAPTHGFGMGEVCPQAVGTGFTAGYAAASRKRHLDDIQATTPVSGRMPWSPPGT
jgi:hypothetical protein